MIERTPDPRSALHEASSRLHCSVRYPYTWEQGEIWSTNADRTFVDTGNAQNSGSTSRSTASPSPVRSHVCGIGSLNHDPFRKT